jgi:hypothetical protein
MEVRCRRTPAGRASAQGPWRAVGTRDVTTDGGCQGLSFNTRTEATPAKRSGEVGEQTKRGAPLLSQPQRWAATAPKPCSCGGAEATLSVFPFVERNEERCS